MRLTPEEQLVIKAAVAAQDPQAEVWLFGSRADDAKRGGDIDLLIFSQILSDHGKDAIWWELQEKLGEQKIDIVIAEDLSEPFVRIAKASGVRL